jgi:hypothetical protein
VDVVDQVKQAEMLAITAAQAVAVQDTVAAH